MLHVAKDYVKHERYVLVEMNFIMSHLNPDPHSGGAFGPAPQLFLSVFHGYGIPGVFWPRRVGSCNNKDSLH